MGAFYLIFHFRQGMYQIRDNGTLSGERNSDHEVQHFTACLGPALKCSRTKDEVFWLFLTPRTGEQELQGNKKKKKRRGFLLTSYKVYNRNVMDIFRKQNRIILLKKIMTGNFIKILLLNPCSYYIYLHVRLFWGPAIHFSNNSNSNVLP